MVSFTDRLHTRSVFIIDGVFLYLESSFWALRGVLGEQHSPVTMLWLLTVITMCTSIFRLSFNKRFFDNARLTNDYQYIFTKSSLSVLPCSIFPGFGGLLQGLDNERRGASSRIGY
jgi:hypothetical protein